MNSSQAPTSNAPSPQSRPGTSAAPSAGSGGAKRDNRESPVIQSGGSSPKRRRIERQSPADHRARSAAQQHSDPSYESTFSPTGYSGGLSGNVTNSRPARSDLSLPTNPRQQMFAILAHAGLNANPVSSGSTQPMETMASLLQRPTQLSNAVASRVAAYMPTSGPTSGIGFSEVRMANLLEQSSGFVGRPGWPGSSGLRPSYHPPINQPSLLQQENTLRQLEQLAARSSLTTLNSTLFPANSVGRGLSLSSLPLLTQSYPSLVSRQASQIRAASLESARASQMTLPSTQSPSGSARSSSTTAQSPSTVAAIPSASALAPAPVAQSPTRVSSLPPIDDGDTIHYSQRPYLPLGIEEDNNWLSEWHCFCRSELIEVFRSGTHAVVRPASNKRISHLQVGLRCRFCADLPLGARATRSSAFPSSIRQIYQSFTMTVRDHFELCPVVPDQMKVRFLQLKGSTSQGASHSKEYWGYAAMKLGLVDSDTGITVTESSLAAAKLKPPFGGSPGQVVMTSSTPLILPEDRTLVSDFLYNLMCQAQMVHLLTSEQVGNRKSLRTGLPGIGCRYCCERGWMGLCRLFPARRRTLRGKIDDFYNHIKRCSACPQEIKDTLENFESRLPSEGEDHEGEKQLLDRIWTRLGHTSARTNSSY